MTKIVLAGLWVDADGASHEGGEVVEVDEALARRLIYRGQGLPATAQEDNSATPTAKTRTKAAGTKASKS